MSERTKDFQIFRIILILGILCSHCGYQFLPGGHCVPFFFILGGFLYHKKENTSYLTYLKKKIIKFFPFYYVCLFLALLIDPPKQFGFEIIPNLLLLNSWIPTTGDVYFPYVGGAWFLSSLLFCYICFPFLAKTIRENKSVSFILLAILITFIKVHNFGEYNIWIKYHCPLFFLLEYSIGYALFHIIKDKPIIQTNPVVVILGYLLYLIAIHSEIKFDLPFAHIIFIAFLYLFKSQQVERIITSQFVITTASYTMHVYLSQLAIERFLMNSFNIYGSLLVILNTILCFALGIIYERVKNLVTQRTPHPS